MAPTTRAGSKRASGEAADTAKLSKRAKGAVRLAIKSAEREPLVREAPQFFRFLDLSPELRNRVYEFAKERDDLEFAPRVFKTYPGYKKKPHTERLWKFFAFAQVCSQIRTEYRPLWVRSCSVRVSSISLLDPFVDGFLHQTDTVKHAPRLLQISWEHGTDNMTRFEMTALLRLRAHCPYFQIDFLPLKVTNGQCCGEDICDPCAEMYFQAEHGLDFDDEVGGCFCPDYAMDHEEWILFKYDQMDCMSGLQDFIHNSNEDWVLDVKDEKVTVSCTFFKVTDRITVKILYKDLVCQTTTNSKPAWDLLKRWGILDLPGAQHDMDFIVAYEDKHTTEQDGYKMVNSVVREVRISKALPKG